MVVVWGCVGVGFGSVLVVVVITAGGAVAAAVAAVAAAALALLPVVAFTTPLWRLLWLWLRNSDTAACSICVDNVSLFCNNPNNLKTNSTVDNGDD